MPSCRHLLYWDKPQCQNPLRWWKHWLNMTYWITLPSRTHTRHKIVLHNISSHVMLELICDTKFIVCPTRVYIFLLKKCIVKIKSHGKHWFMDIDGCDSCHVFRMVVLNVFLMSYGLSLVKLYAQVEILMKVLGWLW